MKKEKRGGENGEKKDNITTKTVELIILFIQMELLSFLPIQVECSKDNENLRFDSGSSSIPQILPTEFSGTSI